MLFLASLFDGTPQLKIGPHTGDGLFLSGINVAFGIFEFYQAHFLIIVVQYNLHSSGW